MDEKVINSLQFNNILSFISSYCVLPSAKDEVFKIRPIIDLKKAEKLLKYTQEAYDLIYFYSFSGVEYFDDVTDELEISLRGGALSMGQLLKVASLMRSSRLFSSFVQSVTEGDFSIFKERASSVYTENYLEKEIFDKIFSEDQMSDNASPLLAELRKKIKNLNIQIKEKLQYYVHTKSDYLQDNIVTMREDRYVIPVKSEYKNKIQGFVHDCSQSGSTYFIEPIEVLEMNNRLKSAIFEEKTEVERILKELSGKVGLIANFLKVNVAILTEIDVNCAKAVYAYKTKAIRPLLNGDGNINIKQGRHPLIDAQKVVPIDVNLGLNYHFLLISGPNTGGKTVTLKMVGLFCLMAMAGIFIQASSSSCVSVFDNVFSDIGDEQSIENSLSTFSSHLKNIIEMAEKCTEKSLILLDEIGGGTNPDEGIALAKALFDKFVQTRCFGIITTHYSALKEYAFSCPLMKNASMEFDSRSYQPLYKINIGSPGSSNALAIAEKLGLNKELVKKARGYLSDSAVVYERLINNAEQVKREAEKLYEDNYALKEKNKQTEREIELEKEKFLKEKEKFLANTKAEGRRILSEKIDEANDLIDEIKEILSKPEIDTGDLIKARSLKNKIDKAQNFYEEKISVRNVDKTLKVGDRVYCVDLGKNATVTKVFENKKKIMVDCDGMELTLSYSQVSEPLNEKVKRSITISRPTLNALEPFKNEINLIGQNVDEALMNLSYFLDKAQLNNVEEVRIIHGIGLQKLSKAIHNYLKTQKNVESFRFGKYGEGQNGVTIVKFK